LGLEKGESTFYGIDAYNMQYSSWKGINAGIGAKLEAFVVGASNLLLSIGIPLKVASSFIAVFIVSFANTTLDSATRIQRLSMQEIFTRKNGSLIRPIHNRYIATLLVVLPAILLTAFELKAKGGLELWRLFGALNQLLAALGLGLVSIYLYHKKKNYLVAFIPMLFVLVITCWAMINNSIDFFYGDKMLLLIISFLILILTLWMLIGGIRSVFNRSTFSL